MAIPATTPPTIAPVLLVAATGLGVEAVEVVGVEVTEVGVEVNEVGIEVDEGVEATEVGLVEVASLVVAAMVDLGTGVVSGPPRIKSQ